MMMIGPFQVVFCVILLGIGIGIGIEVSHGVAAVARHVLKGGNDARK